MKIINAGDIVEFDYLNWKGIKGHRTVFIKCFKFGQTKYHPKDQWLMEAYDYDKHDTRIFAMKDMINVEIVNPIND